MASILFIEFHMLQYIGKYFIAKNCALCTQIIDLIMELIISFVEVLKLYCSK